MKGEDNFEKIEKLHSKILVFVCGGDFMHDTGNRIRYGISGCEPEDCG